MQILYRYNKRVHCFLIIFFMIFLISCEIKPNNNQLNLVMPGDPKSYDPAYATDVRTGQLCALIYDNLVRFSHNKDIIPGLAYDWKISDTGKEYWFFLRDSVKFHDGTHLECSDIKKTFERILDKNTNSHRKWLFNPIKGANSYSKGNATEVIGLSCQDKNILKIELQNPFPPFLSFLAMPSASVVKVDSDGKLIGTGPWILDEWIHDGHILFKSNKAYFDGIPFLESLKIRILPEILPRTAEFITGYLDIMEVPESEFLIWVNDKEWKPNIKFRQQLSTHYLGLNCSRAPFNNKNIRKAMNYAVDVESIIRNIKNGNATHAAGPIPHQLIESNNPNLYYYNPDKARKLLRDAGYENGFEVELWQSQSSELLYITEAIQAQLLDVGIKVKIIRNDWNLFSQAVNEGVPDIYYRSWYADYPDAENFLTPLFESNVSQKRWTRYTNQRVDSLIKKIEYEVNSTKRDKYINTVNSIIIDDAPWVFLWHPTTAHVIQPNIMGWSPSLMFNAEKYNKVFKK